MIWALDQKPVIGVCPYTHAGDFTAKRIWRKVDTVSSWAWEGCEGRKNDVYVYAAAPKVELIINGKSLGVRKTKAYTARFPKIAYEPGTIEAVARAKDGMELGRVVLRSSSGRKKILLSPDVTTLRANGQDLCFLNIALKDEAGTVLSSCDQRFGVEVSGAGRLQAFGSARPCMAEDFVSSTHTSFYGRTLAVIRAGYEPGEITVTVSSERLDYAELKILVETT